MTRDTFDRRDVVKLMAAAGATMPVARSLWPDAAAAAAAYDPAANVELEVKEVELRRNTAGRMLSQARHLGQRQYQPTLLRPHSSHW